MRVEHVNVENFKRFASLTVPLGSLDCLVGPNNSGKTTLLQALALFDFCAHHCLQRRNGQLELRNRTVAPEDFYVLPVTKPMDLWHDRKAMEGGKQKRIRVSVRLSNGLNVAAVVKLDFNRFGISIESEDESPGALQSLADLKIAYLPVFSMFLPREERRLSAAIEDELARGRVHSVIRNLLYDLKNNQRQAELEAILRRSFPRLRELQIRFDEVTDRYIDVTYHEEGRSKEFDIFSAGSGFQQFLYLFGFVLLRQPTVILLDEPDVHLHGSLQSVMLQELQVLVDGGRQVLFATHSRDLITRISPENILSLESDGARRLAVAYDVFDALDRLGSLDPTQLVTVQAYRRVIIVEDQSDRDLLCIFGAKALGVERWQQVERRIAFCYTRGNPWKQHDMSKLRGMLQQVISVAGPALEMFVVGDRDYHPDLAELRATLPTNHIHWHVWERVEIENYLLDLGAIKRLIRERRNQPTLEEQLLEAKFEQLLEASRTRANERLVKAFDELARQRKENRDVVTSLRKASEFLETHWSTRRLELADAKDVVLPGLKRWMQEQGFGQFSDKRLAETLTRDELPEEVMSLAEQIADFAGVREMPSSTVVPTGELPLSVDDSSNEAPEKPEIPHD